MRTEDETHTIYYFYSVVVSSLSYNIYFFFKTSSSSVLFYLCCFFSLRVLSLLSDGGVRADEEKAKMHSICVFNVFEMEIKYQNQWK